jgi:retron-type reverse transcriptase
MFGFLKRLFGGAARVDAAPGKLGVDELARRLGISELELCSTQVTYQEFHVPKRTGGRRQILAPAPPLKSLQRRILRRVLAKLRAHPCATGFERGHSIVTNARPHVGQEMIIKLDFRDFFGSTSSARVERYFRRVGWDADAAALLTRLCTHGGSLPQGAPTSPRLSNLVNVGLDARLDRLARLYGMAYSRYADDVTFSGPALMPAPRTSPKTAEPNEETPGRVNDIIYRAEAIVREDGYTLHTSKKFLVARMHHRQVVTGLVVNRKIQLPRKTRRRIRAVRHRLAITGKATLTAEQLAGWDALQHMIDAPA